MRAMIMAKIARVIVVMRMIMSGMTVIVVVMKMGMAVRPPPVAVVMDALVRMAVDVGRARALALLEDHLGLTASTNAAHLAISISGAFTPSPQAIRPDAPTHSSRKFRLALNKFRLALKLTIYPLAPAFH